MLPRFIDSTAPFDFVAKNGYYQIGDSFASHVGPACQEATRTNQTIQWHFGNEVYNNFNWRSRLNVPITELYRLRAQQLRDKYDYLVLWFSGGADSTTILRSFVDNGIHLDEVMIVWPRSLTNGRYTPNLNTDSSNMVSEWDFSIEPKLKWLATHHPEIKITVLEQFLNPNTSENYFLNNWHLAEKINYAIIDRQYLLDNEIKERYKKHKNIASITGASPPEVFLLNDKWVSVFFVSEASTGAVGKSDYLNDGTPRNVELFYWAHEFPEIIREQGHLILDYLNEFPQFRSIFASSSDTGVPGVFDTRYDMRRQLIKKIVYPTWDLSTFQVGKPRSFYHYPSYYQWFFSNPESKSFISGWEHAIKQHESMISKSFFRKDHQGSINYPSFRTKFYPIGR